MTGNKYRFTGDIDPITFKENNPENAYLSDGTKLSVQDMEDYYTYSNGNNIWRIPKSKFKESEELNPYQRLERDYNKSPVKDIDKVILGTLALGTLPMTLSPLISNIAANPYMWGLALQRTTAGMIGYEGVNELNKVVNGETWGEGINRLTNNKVPIWVGELTNPGGLLEGVTTNSVNKLLSLTVPKQSIKSKVNKLKDLRGFEGQTVQVPSITQQLANSEFAYNRIHKSLLENDNPLQIQLKRLQTKYSGDKIPSSMVVKPVIRYNDIRNAVQAIDPTLSNDELNQVIGAVMSNRHGVNIPIGDNSGRTVSGLSFVDIDKATKYLKSKGIETPTAEHVGYIAAHESGHDIQVPKQIMSLVDNYVNKNEFFPQAGQILNYGKITNSDTIPYSKFMRLAKKYLQDPNTIDNGITEFVDFMENVPKQNRKEIMKAIGRFSTGPIGLYMTTQLSKNNDGKVQ